ncbi:hypothetical protein CDD83_11186 [Cordyceps sp. RAO-2017]|nr:hypothetical protein CDD83_11186 [Cordyceps sp. RAO-2017]
MARGAAALAALRRRPERLVFVVSHSGFLRLAVAGRWFFNADWRLFRFAVAEADVVDRRLLLQGHVLEQDESTLAGGLGLSWTDAVEIGSEMEEDDDDDQGSEAAAEAVNEAAVP